MTLANNTPHAAQAVPLLDSRGRSVVVAIVKATFSMDSAGRWVLAEEPSPVRVNDVLWYPEAADSSYRYPSDAVPEKVGTDVVFVGEAISARAVGYLDVAIQMRGLRKTVRVHGERLFYRRGSSCAIGGAAGFERRPVVYELAYGGVSKDSKVIERRNPVGRGVAASAEELDGRPAPCIEDPRAPITSSSDRPGPGGVGAIGPHWLPRAAHAGTFDAAWRKGRMPLMPVDFSARHYNVAPPDQILDPPIREGEEVAVLNMREGGRDGGLLRFVVPRLSVVVFGRRADGETLRVRPPVDTLLVEPGRARVEMTMRAALPKGRGATTLREIRVDEEQE